MHRRNPFSVSNRLDEVGVGVEASLLGAGEQRSEALATQASMKCTLHRLTRPG
jgi:hypothetical protein